MKDLSPDILNAVDIDIPGETLTMTVLVPPAHGTLLNGIYGLEMSRYKSMSSEDLQRTLAIQSFTVQELQQGQFSNKWSTFCGPVYLLCLPEGDGLLSLWVSRLAEQMLLETKVTDCLWCFSFICKVAPTAPCTVKSQPLCTWYLVTAELCLLARDKEPLKRRWLDHWQRDTKTTESYSGVKGHLWAALKCKSPPNHFIR